MAIKCIDQYVSDRAALYNGDSVEVLKAMPADSAHYAIFSPPFASLYTYSNSERDLGNCKSRAEFFTHYRFIAAELYRILKPGRNFSFHAMQLPSTKERDGFIGIHDFRGDLIREHQKDGFIFHSEVCIWKDPVTAMQRTKAIGLLYKQLRKDSCLSRQGIPDYLVTMRKPGENKDRVTKTFNGFPVSKWQGYASPAWDDIDEMAEEAKKIGVDVSQYISADVFASLSRVAKAEVYRIAFSNADKWPPFDPLYPSPLWMDISPSKTLQRESAREDNDERHICPLQLQVIERGIELWTNPGDVVLSPYAGIGSEGYVALKLGRKFVGCELKQSYYAQARKNLMAAEQITEQGSLLDGAGAL